MKKNRAVGADYEQKAAQYLEGLGYQILERNFRCRTGELDLVAKEGGYLAFIEVKYRTGVRMGEPQEAVNYRKRKKICMAAAYYCMVRRIPPQQPCRFDVVACLAGEWKLIRNAFDYVQ